MQRSMGMESFMSRHNRVQNYTKHKIIQQNPSTAVGKPPTDEPQQPCSSADERLIAYSSSEDSVMTQHEGAKLTEEPAPVRTQKLKQYMSKGKVYRYHYPSRVRIRAEPDTPEFAEEMARAEAEWRGKLSAPESLAEAIKLFQAHAAFQRLNCLTRNHLCSVIRWLPRKFGGTALANIDRLFLLTLRRTARAAHGAIFGNAASLLLQLVISWAVEEGRLPSEKGTLGKPAKAVRSERRRVHQRKAG
jgi:hypothetical protein